MLAKLDIEKVLFLDVETIPQYPAYEKMPETTQALWDAKAKYLVKDDKAPKDVYQRAGIYAEFGRIICISVGILKEQKSKKIFRIKSFFGDDEKHLLSGFITLLKKNYNTQSHYLCAHNGKEFDFPYLARRMLINGLKLPKILDLSGKKPWEVRHLDTLELWKFGDRKHYTSLNLMTHIFNIPTPKDEMDGSDVWRMYWQEKGLLKIVNYCQKDVLATTQLLMRFRGEPLIDVSAVTVVE
ncbi:MAG: 3'-5' exonuclease [Flavobacteriales bacterium]|nr:MAG: 3'-5' exonuclease [Flavobacteriales bacterium]